MGIKSFLYDPLSKFAARVTSEGALQTVEHPHPPQGETVHNVPFRQYFTDDGLSGGTNSMAVNGSSTTVEYWIPAADDADLYIKTISVQISDTGTVDLSKFGAESALANGVEFCHVSQDTGATIIHQGIDTNLEFIRLGLSTAGHGDGTTAFQADVSGGGGTATYLPVIDLEQTFGYRFGLRLRKGTEDKLVFKVQDNLSGLAAFNAIGYGIRQ